MFSYTPPRLRLILQPCDNKMLYLHHQLLLSFKALALNCSSERNIRPFTRLHLFLQVTSYFADQDFKKLCYIVKEVELAPPQLVTTYGYNMKCFLFWLHNEYCWFYTSSAFCWNTFHWLNFQRRLGLLVMWYFYIEVLLHEQRLWIFLSLSVLLLLLILLVFMDLFPLCPLLLKQYKYTFQFCNKVLVQRHPLPSAFQHTGYEPKHRPCTDVLEKYLVLWLS